jgi:hypothetical protein
MYSNQEYLLCLRWQLANWFTPSGNTGNLATITVTGVGTSILNYEVYQSSRYLNTQVQFSANVYTKEIF